MPDATLHAAFAVVILWRVELIPFLHYGLVTLLGIATIAVLWFAGYVLYRLYSD